MILKARGGQNRNLKCVSNLRYVLCLLRINFLCKASWQSRKRLYLSSTLYIYIKVLMQMRGRNFHFATEIFYICKLFLYLQRTTLRRREAGCFCGYHFNDVVRFAKFLRKILAFTVTDYAIYGFIKFSLQRGILLRVFGKFRGLIWGGENMLIFQEVVDAYME